MIKQTTYKIAEIKSRVEAAEKLQEAGQYEEVEIILKSLGKDLTEALGGN